MIHQRTVSMIACLLATLCFQSRAFSSQQNLKHVSQRNVQLSGPTTTTTTTTTTLNVGGGLFGGLFGGQSEQEQGPKIIINLPANTVKVGALKFFLQIFLVGEQNKPVQGAWVLSNSGETLDMYYKDGSGMFSIDLKETGIQIVRNGQKPSLEYMLQESVMLHGVLDEFRQIAFETEDIDPEKRLLQFPDSEAIDKARETLPARKEN